ncbi:MAG TPA: hypothetical protein VHZ95_16520 [Polyangiales bacterium]|nr:hypothetical protein [Polyangiales bacterium]
MSAPASASSQAKPIKKRGRLAATRAGSLLMRLSLGVCGAGLVAGFFMRWMTVGDIVAVSGFGLMVTQGEAITLLSGAHRFVLLEVPLFGLLLMIGAFVGHRFVLWIALLTGLGVLGFGLFTVVRLFFQTTGLGMWVVVASAFLAFGLSLIGLGRASR